MKTPAEVDQAFEYAKGAGMKLIVGVPKHDLLPLVNEKVQKYDIRVAIHNHGPKDKVYPMPSVAYEKIKDLDRRHGHLSRHRPCHSTAASIRAARPNSSPTGCSTSISRIDATPRPKGRTIEVGRGVIDIPKFLRTLEKINYTGIVSFEFENNPDDPLPGLAESVGYVKGVLAVI